MGEYKSMRIFRLAIVVLFFITSAVFGMYFVNTKLTEDNTIPVIKIEEELIEVSFETTDEELLKGVTAYDEKDKDITDRVIVESVSRFVSDGVCKVTYAVCDSDNNVANATRKIKYKDYESPKFSISGGLCFSVYDSIDLSKLITADDCIDGDITRNIIITSEDFTKSTAGVFGLEISVSNSKGDLSIINIPLVVEDRSVSAPKIKLSEYLIYVKPGEEVDFSKYLVEARDRLNSNLTSNVRIETNADLNKEGTYSVHYYVNDSTNAQGHTILNVIVG
jgi:hypothetical protein